MEYFLPKGFQFAGVSCGCKTEAGAKDVAVIVSQVPAVATGVYTQNQVVAAPVELCRSKTPTTDVRAVVVNSGNANACTGAQGTADAQRMCDLASEASGGEFTADQTLVMSTGIIGQFLPMANIEAGIRQATRGLAESEQAFLDASDGLLTTDVARKVATRRVELGQRVIHIAGMAKGAGMIGPNMATMLCCLLTDAPLGVNQAQRLLNDAAGKSFNNISVEGHTSTNDTMLLLANGQAGGAPLSEEEEVIFAGDLQSLCIELAKMIPADGEGASHLIEVSVTGAASEDEARQIAREVAGSNLVKTAVYGCDPNWGRIVSAAGYAGVPLDKRHLNLKLNGISLFEAGEPVTFDAPAASKSIRDHHTTRIELNVGNRSGQCVHWTSDLTVEYVRFNSEYTT